MSKQQPFSAIVSVNPYQKDYYTSNLNTISQVTSPSFSKEQYAISFLNTKSFITALIGVSKNIPYDDIYDALENKVYEELALDMAVEYQIQYLEAINRISDSDRFFHVFVVDPLTLEQEFTSAIESLKYLDQIIPTPLLLKSLYTKELIDSSATHGFVYFQEDDAFFTVYTEQEFIYSKSLKYSLKQMHERFCELLGENIELDSFKNLLGTQGLNPSNIDYQKNLFKLFGEVFLHISDIITYSKRAFDVKQFETIYIGSATGNINGLDEYAQTYLGLPVLPFNFNYGLNIGAKHVDDIHQLMHLYTRLETNERYECNFTIFHRPPLFAKRDSGKLILVTAAALAAALLYPGTYWGLSYIEEFHYTLMSQEYDMVHIEKQKRELTINYKLKEKKIAQTLLDEETNAYKQKQDTLTQVHEKKVDYPMKAKIAADFTRSFNQYQVKLNSFSYHENSGDMENNTSGDQNKTVITNLANSQKTFSFMLTAPKTQNITALLKHLTATKQAQYDFDLKLISYDNNSSTYLSELKAVLK